MIYFCGQSWLTQATAFTDVNKKTEIGGKRAKWVNMGLKSQGMGLIANTQKHSGKTSTMLTTIIHDEGKERRQVEFACYVTKSKGGWYM